jgi:CRISPR/Cas system CSM-associated protein Csm5 (group 7 of RAMP superfamily)
MAELNKKYNLAIEILTPLCIGAGIEKNWVKGVDFVVKDRKVYKLDLRKIITSGVEVSKLILAFERKDDETVLQLLGNKLGQVSDAVFSSPASTSDDIKSFVKNELSGKPIIPGSSLKGAIRSILFQYFGGRSKDGREVFGSSTKGDEFMRFIKIADAEFEKTQLINTKLFNLRRKDGNLQGGWKHGSREGTTAKFNNIGFNTVYESIMPHQTSYSFLMISVGGFNNVNWNDFYDNLGNRTIKMKTQLMNNTDPIRALFGVINNHTRRYLQKEKAFFNCYNQAENTQKIIDDIDKLLQQIPETDSYCILKMSAGSGFHSITGDWQFDDYTITDIINDRGRNRGYGIRNGNNEKSAKSRKIAIHGDCFSLMGFIKLTAISDEKMHQMERKKAEDRATAEALKIAAERKQAEDLRIVKEKQENYASLINEAQNLYNDQNYDLSLLKYRQAAEIFSDGKLHADKIIEIQNKIQKERIEQEYEDRLRMEKEAAAKHRQEQIEGGLSFLNEKYDDGRFKVVDFKGTKNRIESWLKKSKNKQLPFEQIDILTNTLHRIYHSISKDKDKRQWANMNSGIWIDVAKWVDDGEIEEIFSRTMN